MKIIAFTGMPFSGKSEAVQIAKDIGIHVVRMGDMVWDEVKKRGLKINDENVGVIANQMREQHGKDIWAKRTIEKIKSLKNAESIIIDGIRNVEEISTFKRELKGDFIIIAVEVPDEVRHKRALSRGRADDSKNLDKIKERDKREIGWGIDTVIASADMVIINDRSVKEFHEKIKDVLSKL
jgi:dephospho-CoA kinase